MFIKLTDTRRKTLIIIGGFLSLVVLMIAVILAVGYIFFRSYGWFAFASDLRTSDMQVRMRREPFELAVVEIQEQGVTVYDQHSPYNSSHEAIVYLSDEEYAILDETNGDTPALFFRLSDEKPGADPAKIAPGDFGTISFDIVPLTSEDLTFYIYFTRRGLGVEKHENAPDTLVEVDNTDGTLDYLLGHILLFKDRTQIETSGYYYYSDLFTDDYLEYTMSDHTADRYTVNGEDHYRVTLYWVWPTTFAQIAFAEGDVRLHSHALFGDATERADFMEYVADNNSLLFMDLAVGASYTNPGDEDTYYIELSDGYNNADQVIGDNVKYYILEAHVMIDPPEAAVTPTPTPDPEPEP
ncbi:MAG: hypothetical protein IJT70_07215 [Clostridia bacterium]|nr:hypothetical protein [Clostridia bacterium]